MTSKQDNEFMSRAIELARKGAGRVSPNPMVGCVVVKNSKIIGEGYHRQCGSAHAEVNALKNIKAKNASLYVTLEPCHHSGKTGPCVDVVIASGVKRVVIAMKDPNPKTNGKSIRKLRSAGIKVDTGVCKKEAEELNRIFIKNITKKKTYVICKIAQSLDGKISIKGKRTQITGKEAFNYVQILRSEVDAILVGRNTIKIDDPQLTVRAINKRQPKRVVLDSQLKTDLKSRLFKVPGGDIIFITNLPKHHKRVIEFQKYANVLCVASKKHKSINLSLALKRLYDINILSVLVEGGSAVFSSLYEAKLADEWQFITAPKILGDKGLPAFVTKKKASFSTKHIKYLGSDCLYTVHQN